MEEWIYNNKIVQEHSLFPLCGSTLNDVSNKDYAGKYKFNPDMECLDMDEYEKNVLRKGQSFHTGDAVMGISTYENNRSMSPRLLVVELRMGYVSTSNLSKKDMEDKVTYTKSLLGGEKPINSESIFIFNNGFIEQAKSWFARNRRTGGELKNCIPVSVSEFSEKVKSQSDFPYIPIHKEENVRKNILQCEKEADWINVFRYVTYWCEKAEEYKYRNPSEFEHLTAVLKKIWTEFNSKKYSFNEEEELNRLIIEEDFDFLIN